MLRPQRNRSSPARKEIPPRAILRRADQACAAAIIAASLAVMAAYWLREFDRHDDLLELVRDPPPPPEFKIDVNAASWPEFALLPEVGETLAKRIVESREREGPFLDHNDLRRVRGIGPHTLARMRPYLLPITPAEEAVDSPR